MNQPSEVRPMNPELCDEVLEDCSNVIFNSVDCKAQGRPYYNELEAMAHRGCSEQEIYVRLKEISEEIYAS